MKKSVFITGASSGIGLDAAIYLSKRNWAVYAGVRKDSDAEFITEKSNGQIKPVFCDVTEEESVKKAGQLINSDLDGKGLDALINNAGIVVSGPLEFMSAEDLNHQFEVNVAGLMRTTRVFLPLLRKARGRIINISSISGHVAFPFLGAYAMSKYSVEALSDALRIELLSAGIPVSLIAPGAIKTPIWEKSSAHSQKLRASYPEEGKALYGDKLDSFSSVIKQIEKLSTPVSSVSSKIYKVLSVSRPRARYFVGLDARIQYWLKKLLPAFLFDRLVHKAMRL